MSCCTNTIQPFSFASTTTIAYAGDRPTVSVIYLQPDSTFLTAGVFTQIDIQPTQVVINHGGPASGYVKLMQ